MSLGGGFWDEELACLRELEEAREDLAMGRFDVGINLEEDGVARLCNQLFRLVRAAEAIFAVDMLAPKPVALKVADEWKEDVWKRR